MKPLRPLILALVLLGLSGASGATQEASPPLIGAPAVYFPSTEDTLADIAVRFGIGYTELMAANRHMDPWLPRPGIPVILPTWHLLPDAPRRGIVINLPEQRLYYFPEDGPPVTYPIGIGTDNEDLFTGETRVVLKRKNPSWRPTPSMRARDPSLPEVIPPGPDNPLGAYALNLGIPYIVIHGTNRPYSVGRRSSSGCFRLYPQHIEALFARVAVGTPVTVIDQPVKAAWHEGRLYVEVHPGVDESEDLALSGRLTAPPDLAQVRAVVARAAGERADMVDWAEVDLQAVRRTGLPVPVTPEPTS